LNPHYCDHKFAFLYDPCKEPEGIPFYLPKPLLIVAKNFRNIEETKVGLTDSAPIPNFFDDQAKYADLNARTNFAGLDGTPAAGTPANTSGDEKFPTGDAANLASVAKARVYSGTGAPISPGAVAPDGLRPETFYTYHIVFVPDMTQKYGLKIKGGAGEIRAAMNLVNGWQFTGLGPYYMKDSSTAQNTLAGGITANLAASGVADVVKAVAGLKPGAALPGAGETHTATPPQPLSPDQVKSVTDAMMQLHPRFIPIPAYAEISIYEPYISPEGTMEWKPIAEKSYDRSVLTTDLKPHETMRLLQSAGVVTTPTGWSAAQGTAGQGTAGQAAGASGTGAQGTGAQGGGANPTGGKPATPPGAGTTPDLTPLKPGNGASRVMPLPVPRVSLAPGPTLRRSSIQTLLPEGPKVDDAVVQAQIPPPPAPGLPPAPIAPLEAAPDTPPGTNAVVVPPGTNAVVVPPGTNVTAVPPGTATIAVAPGTNLTSVPPGTTIPGSTVSAISTTSAALQGDLLRHMFTQAGVLPAASVPALNPVIGVPTAPSTAGNQINLNQYFGRTQFAAPSNTAAEHRFSLFHHKDKERPKMRTIQLSGLEAAAVGTLPSQANLPNAPATLLPTASSTVIPGTGSPPLAPGTPTRPGNG
jgi:hypothetical protein